MKIEHIAMYVKDLEKEKLFFEKYFGGLSNEKYINTQKGFSSYFIRFDDGARLEIMNNDIHQNDMIGGSLGYAHIAISVGSCEKVRELTEQLRTDGYKILSEPRTTGDGYYESCVADTEGNQIEITV